MVRARALLAALLLLMAAAVGQKASAPVAMPIERAESAMDRKAWPEAEAILRKLVAANAKDGRAWFDLGYVMHAQHNYAEAITAYQGAVAALPESFECNLNLGLMLAHEHRPEASKYLEAATHLKPTGAHPNESMARCWRALAEVEEREGAASADAWGHAVELAPANADGHVGYGTALEKAGKSADAERELRKAGEIDPTSQDAMTALANFYMRAKRLTDAEPLLAKLAVAAPQDESTHLQLGRVLFAEGKAAESIPEFNKALALRVDDWEALRALAVAEEQSKQLTEATASYRKLLEHFPADADVHDGLGMVLLKQLQYGDAAREFAECIKLRPEWTQAYAQLATAASGNKEYELAIRALDARKKLAEDTPMLSFLRATCYDHLRLYPAAVVSYKAFLAADKGEHPDEQWKAQHRLMAIDPEERKKR